MPPSDIRLRQLLASRKGAWSLSLLLGWITLIAVLGLLAVSGWFITASAAAGLLVAGAYSFDFFRPAALIRLAAMTRTAGRYAERLSSHHAVLALLQDLRCRVFGRLAANPASTLQSSARQQHRLVADIDLLDRFPLSVVAPWFWASSILVLLLAFYSWLSPQLLYAALAGLVSGWLLLPLLTGQQVARLARLDADKAEERRVFLLHSLQLRVPLVIWQQWQNRQQKFAALDADYLQHQAAQTIASSRLLLWQHWALALGFLLMLWVAGPLLASGQLQLPWLVAALLAYLGFYEVVAPLTTSFIALGLSQAARDRLNQLGQTQAPASAALNPLAQAGQLAPQLSLQQLQVVHAGERRFDLELQAGDILLVTGPSGSGKSSLLETLAGHLPPLQGRCLFDGQAYDSSSAAGMIGYLPQQFDLFNLGLAQNLRLGVPAATDAELWQVLEQVALADWAKAQPLQLDTPLGEHAVAVSGGQARRIALARLLLRRQPLLLLDEPFAGLDTDSASRVLHSICQHQQDSILVLVSHDVPPGLEQFQERVQQLHFQP
ncbi:MAG: ATP-binding cassette domain-containing protein [Pseudomonas sp.]